MRRNLVQLMYLSAVVLLSILNTAQSRITITTANSSGADTFLSNDGQTGSGGSNGAPTAIHGTEGSIGIRRYDGTRQKIGYIRFDLTGVSGSLTGATLSFNLTSSNRTRVWGIYGLVDETGDSWPEATTSYNTAPGFIANPPTALSYYAIDETKLQRLGTMNIINAPAVYTSNDVNLPLDSFIGSDTNKLLTFAIIPDSTDNNASYWITSKEGNPSLAPMLNLPNALIPPATYPSPANGSLVYSMTVNLQWQAGSYAVKHDVYIGTSSEDVNKATTSTPVIYKDRIDPNNYTAADLIPNTTYYWRIDEVRADGTTIDRGEIWSFSVVSVTAWAPVPTDNFMYVAPKMTLRWNAGAGAVDGYNVYLGDSFDQVNNAPEGSENPPFRAFLEMTADPNWNPAQSGFPLAFNKTYYWRIDEINGSVITIGNVWQFRTVDQPLASDPNHIGQWSFDGDLSDFSYGCDGTAYGNPLPSYVSGMLGSGIYLIGTTSTGQNQYIDLPIGSVISTLTDSTFAIWVNFQFTGGGQKWHRIFDFGSGTTNYMFLAPRRSSSPPTHFEITTGGNTQRVSWGAYGSTGTNITSNEWHHLAVTISEPNESDTRTFTLYVDGEQVGVNTAATLTPSDLGFTTQNWLGRAQGWAGTLDPALFMGYLDDFRIYDRALSQAEIQDILTPSSAWRPSPADRATDVHANPILSWTSGKYAAQHDIYFGTDFNAVNGATTSTVEIYKGRQSGNYYEIELLESQTTYYWRVDEVNDPNFWKGAVWSFTTGNYLVVDNMESYGDANTPGKFGGRIWYAWNDGTGWTNPPPGKQGNGTGSMVDLSETPVNSGSQSLKFDYDNTGSTGKTLYSEISQTFATPQNWTVKGVKAIDLWFYGGASSSVEPLYVAVQDSFSTIPAIVNYLDPNALLEAKWHQWSIDLNEFGKANVNLTSVKTIYIGVGRRTAPQLGGTGTLYFDDIGLYPPRCFASIVNPDADLNGDCVVNYSDVDVLAEQWLNSGLLVMPIALGNTNLVGHWKFDDGSGNTAVDSTANANHGLILGDLQWIGGHDGGALWFPGVDDYVELPIGSLINSLTNSTFAIWANFSNTGGNWQRIFDFGTGEQVYMYLTPRLGATGVMRFAITVGGSSDPNEQRVSAPSTLASGWHHVGVTINANADTITLYQDGLAVAQNTQATLSPSDLGATTNNWLGRSQFSVDAYYAGRLDDFRIYNRALSGDEVASLAGKTSPVSEFYDLNIDGSINFKDFAKLAQDWLEEKLWP